MNQTKNVISDKDLKELKHAKELLESPGLAAKITQHLDSPIEKGLKLLPSNFSTKLGHITKNSLLKATDAAIFTINNQPSKKTTNTLHKIAAGATGTIGGIFGLAGLAFELPITTTIILRSIADIARFHGETLNKPETKLACLEVFALGKETTEKTNVESSYYSTRTILANSITNVSKYITEQGIAQEGTPLFFKFITKIAEKFGIQITEKTIAQSLPIVGAAGGAIINTLFIDHFQDMATGHFIVRKLERKYNAKLVKHAYENM
ncbi:EcsC family protein [Tenacibaculum sp. 190524A02b]|uniref:EcsC family protein n=1 Tax=Tenacibaculum vairaonense TaxID=3137860 RepID=UPI0031FAE4CC